MIEVMFGESEASSMKCAKNRKSVIRGEDGPTVVFGNPDLLPPREALLPNIWAMSIARNGFSHLIGLQACVKKVLGQNRNTINLRKKEKLKQCIGGAR